jgi:transposase-like protein
MNRKYTVEFKQQAAKLAKDLGSPMEASRQLGVPKANIYTWMQEYSDQPMVVASRKLELKPEELLKEIQKLNQENTQLKKVNHILKAAAAFFSQDHLK